MLGRGEVAALLRAAWRSLDQRLDLRRRSGAASARQAELAELVVIVVGQHGEDRIEFLQSARPARRVLLQEFAAVHGRVDVADQIEHGGERLAVLISSARPARNLLRLSRRFAIAGVRPPGNCPVCSRATKLRSRSTELRACSKPSSVKFSWRR